MVKFVNLLLSVSTLISFSGGVYPKDEVPKVEGENVSFRGSACPISRTYSTEEDEFFISKIEEQFGISVDSDEVFVEYNQNGTVSIGILKGDGTATLYTSMTEKQYDELMFESEERGILSTLWTAVVILYNVYDLYGTIKDGCEVVEGVSGVDVCGYISREMLNNLVPKGSKGKFKTIRTVEKFDCPYPPHSQQCNEPPYAYFKTELVPA